MSISHHAGHGHHTAEGKLLVSIALNILITVAELIGGILANSLALVSDALHNFSDVMALGMSYFGERVKERPTTARMTFGFRRAETLIALINAVSLGAIAIYIFLEALERWQNPQPIIWQQVLWVGSIALAGNLISVWILRSEKERNLNLRSAFLHLFYDAISAIGVMASAVVIGWTGLYSIDLVVSIGIGLLIIGGSLDLLKGIYIILMEGVPPGVDSRKILGSIRSLDGVLDVHHLHVWSISSDLLALSAHIVIDPSDLQNLDGIMKRVTAALKEKQGVDHVTLQPELMHCADPAPSHEAENP